jgi:hypothetical protein
MGTVLSPRAFDRDLGLRGSRALLLLPTFEILRRPVTSESMKYERSAAGCSSGLETLNAAPRVTADARAAAYLHAHDAPSGALRIPMLSDHTLGDGLTSPTLEWAYARQVQSAGRCESAHRLGRDGGPARSRARSISLR